MSFARSACAFGSRGVLGRTTAVLFLLSLAWPHPGPASAQTATAFPPLSFRQRLELEVLGEASKDFAHAPSFRVALQRRETLRRSDIVSGMLLFDPLSRSAGVAVGQMLTFGGRGSLLEPFAEVGAAFSDARVLNGSYEVFGSGGLGSRVIPRYRAVRGPSALAGAGVSWSGIVHDRTAVRFTVGYWQLAGRNGFRHGSLRVGVSLGWARRDARWYTLASDRTPPAAVVVGRDGPSKDSVEVSDGKMRVMAADANGIADIHVNGANIPFAPAPATTAHSFGLGTDAVVGTAEVRLPFEGQRLNVAVRDSAGLTTHSTVWAFPAPDHEPPTVSVLGSGGGTSTLDPRFRARVDDPSGVAYARLGVCPVGLLRPPPDPANLGDMNVTVRLVDGWGAPAEEGRQLEVRDRFGNVARVSLPSAAPEIPDDAAPPRLTDLTAAVGVREPDRMSVRVRGSALDSAGGWIAHVDVDGEPAVLRVTHDPSDVEFDGWLLARPDADQVTVVATTVDGRTVRESVPIGDAAPNPGGRLYTVLVYPDATADLWADLRGLAHRAGDDDPKVLIGTGATPAAVLRALAGLQERVGPADVVLFHLEGTLSADLSAVGPSVDLSAGRLDLGRVDRLLQRLDAGVTLVSTAFRNGPSWPIGLTDLPGVQPPAGCYEDDTSPAGTVFDTGLASPEQILRGLAGAADRDRDGRVLTLELLSYVGLSPAPGLLSFDPLQILRTVGGDR